MEHYCRDTLLKSAATFVWMGVGLLALSPVFFWLAYLGSFDVTMIVCAVFLCILGIIVLIMGIRGLTGVERSVMARSLRRYLPEQERGRPVDELFELVDQDLNQNGMKLLNGKLIVGREWLFVRETCVNSPMRVDQIYGMGHEMEHEELSLCIVDQIGHILRIQKVTREQIRDVHSYLNTRVPQLVVWEDTQDMRRFSWERYEEHRNADIS